MGGTIAVHPSCAVACRRQHKPYQKAHRSGKGRERMWCSGGKCLPSHYCPSPKELDVLMPAPPACVLFCCVAKMSCVLLSTLGHFDIQHKAQASVKSSGLPCQIDKLT